MRRCPPPVKAVALGEGVVTVGAAAILTNGVAVLSVQSLLDLLRSHEKFKELTVVSVRLTLPEGAPGRRRIAAKGEAPVDGGTEAVAQRISHKSLSNRLALAEGDVVRVLGSVDADWLEGECAGRRGRFLRTALCDVGELTLEAEWGAEGANAFAQWDLGWRLLEGWSGLARDEPRGAQWIRRAAAQGHVFSRYSLAGFLEQGRTMPQDEKAARAMLEACAAQEHAFAQHDLGCTLMREGEHERGYALLLAAAEQGLAAAMNYVGYCHQRGMGATQDLEMAIYWLMRAISDGDVLSKHELGLLYLQDLHDVPTAVEWFTKASEPEPYAASMTELGMLHLRDDYLDVARARALLTAASERGAAKAMTALAMHFYDSGEFENAARWLEAVLQAGHKPSPVAALLRCYRKLNPDLPRRAEKLP